MFAQWSLLTSKALYSKTMDCPRSAKYDGSTSDVQWVEISGCQYSITEGELLCWLHLYCDSLTKMNEMVHPDSDPVSPMGNT